jgi:uncharacterized membrane protein YuzA (DUF378 family)
VGVLPHFSPISCWLLAALPILLATVLLAVLYVIHSDLFWAGVYFLMYLAVFIYERILLVFGLTGGLGLVSGGLIGFFSPLPLFNKRPYLMGSLISILAYILAGIAAVLYFIFGLQASALALQGFLYLVCLGPLVCILTVLMLRRIYPRQNSDSL